MSLKNNLFPCNIIPWHSTYTVKQTLLSAWWQIAVFQRKNEIKGAFHCQNWLARPFLSQWEFHF